MFVIFIMQAITYNIDLRQQYVLNFTCCGHFLNTSYCGLKEIVFWGEISGHQRGHAVMSLLGFTFED